VRVVGIGVADVELRGMALPEVAQAKPHAAADSAHVPDARRARARRGLDPAVARLGALLDLKAVGRQLAERVVAPRRDQVQTRADVVRKGLDRRRRLASDLRPLHLATWIAPQPGQPAHGFGPQPVAFADKAYVPVVRLVAHGDLEAHAQAREEVLVLVTVKDKRVHQAEGVPTRVEVKPHCERQPRPFGRADVLALDPHDGADGAGLLDEHLADHRGKRIAVNGVGVGGVLTKTEELHAGCDRLAVAFDRLNDGRAAPGDADTQDARVHVHGFVCFLHRDRLPRRRCLAGRQNELLRKRAAAATAADRVGRPLQ
jgi:hypothetical protein